MKIQRVISDRDGWYELSFYAGRECALQSATLTFPHSHCTVVASDETEAALLIDVLRAHPEDGQQYENEAFILQRNYDQKKAKVPYPTYNYDLFTRVGKPSGRWVRGYAPEVGDFVGSLPPENFEELSAKVAQHYLTTGPLGTIQSYIDKFDIKLVQNAHVWD